MLHKASKLQNAKQASKARAETFLGAFIIDSKCSVQKLDSMSTHCIIFGSVQLSNKGQKPQSIRLKVEHVTDRLIDRKEKLQETSLGGQESPVSRSNL